MIGYHETGGYEVYDPILKQVSASRDVYIDESSGWS